MICENVNCGREIPDDAVYCSYCAHQQGEDFVVTGFGDFVPSSSVSVILGSTETVGIGLDAVIVKPQVVEVGLAIEHDTAGPVTPKKTYHPELSYPHVGMSILRTLCESRGGDREPALRIDVGDTTVPLLQMYDVPLRELVDQGYIETPNHPTVFVLTEKGKQYCQDGKWKLAEYEPFR